MGKYHWSVKVNSLLCDLLATVLNMELILGNYSINIWKFLSTSIRVSDNTQIASNYVFRLFKQVCLDKLQVIEMLMPPV